jgi:parvulin-like peptidyl-prolyl isomerase
MRNFLIMMILITALTAGLTACNEEPATSTQQTDTSVSTSNIAHEVRAKHILVETQQQAEEIKSEIEAGKTFEEAAAEYSTCPSSSKGGDLGFFKKGVMVPEFEEAAFSLPVGDVSKPIETQFGWHLIKVEEKR